MGWPYQQKPPSGWPLDYASGLVPNVGFWPMSEGSGNIVSDLSGNNGTFVGTAPGWDTGDYGSVVKLPGTNEYISCGDIGQAEGITALTVRVRFKPNAVDANNNNRQLIAKWQAGQQSWVLGYRNVNTNTIWFIVNTGSAVTAYGSVAVNDTSKWYDIVGVYDGVNVRVYIDTVGGTPAAQTGTINASTSSVTIGAYSRGNAPYTNGQFDLPMIYNYALIAFERVQLYREPFCMFKDPAEMILMAAGQTAPSAGIPIFRRRRAG